jgi:hypothetical protein
LEEEKTMKSPFGKLAAPDLPMPPFERAACMLRGTLKEHGEEREHSADE